MLRYLVERLGVDYLQWRALTITGLKLDLRVASLGQMDLQRQARSDASATWIMRLLLYVIMGAILSPLIWSQKDVFVTGTVYLAYIMVMVAMAVLIDFSAVVLSPDDFAILGYQPISSRTFFMARLTNVLAYTSAVTLALGAVPVTTYCVTRGWNLVLGLAAVAATLMSSTATTLTLILLYAWILQFVHPARLRRILNYLQFIMSFLIYGGYLLLPRLLDTRLVEGAHLDTSPWINLFPASWFAGLLRLAAGDGSTTDILRTAGAFLSIGVLFALARGRLSLDYAAALSSASSAGEGNPAVERSARRRPAFFFKTGEERAVSLLIRNQFRYDQKFRLAVLGILPITFFYLIISLQQGTPKDPFIEGEAGFGNIWMIYLAATLLPPTLRQSLIHSDAYAASWIYFATPADRGRLVLATKDFIYACFVLPYLTLVGLMLLYFFRHPLHVLLELLLLALLTHFILQLTTLFSPSLPFSQPVQKGQRSGSLVLLMILCPFLGVGVVYAFSRWIYPRPMLHFWMMAAMVGLTWLLEKAVHARIEKESRRLRYAGA